jgi:hypothetical protein
MAAYATLLFSLTATATSTTATSNVQHATPAICASASAIGAGDNLARFQCLPASDQATVLRDRIEDGTLDEMPASRVVALIDGMKPDAIIAYVRLIVGRQNSYEYRMRRRERVNGKWPAQDDHMEVLCQDTPRRVYVRWLPDGAHAGQEIIYDETRDPNHFLGHFGGAWRLFSGKFLINGAVARLQSRHSVRDLGLQFIVRTLEHDASSFEAEGMSAKPDHIELLNTGGKRELALTWDAPTGPPTHFASRVTLTLDLDHAQLRGVTAKDLNGNLLEEISFEQIVPEALTDNTFDPHNPNYNFH